MTKRLPETTQLLYTELLQALLVAESPKRGISFHRKTVDDRAYWYLDYVIGSAHKAYYLGADTSELTQRIEDMKSRWNDGAPDARQRARLVAMVKAGGATEISGAHARVLEALAQAGVFAVGGVLVGSHAFALLGNMLGVSWERAALRTQDVDIARDYKIHVTVPPADLPNALNLADSRFIPVPSLDLTSPSTSFKIRGQDLSVSVLTPMRGKPSASPVAIPALQTMAEPLRFLDYVLEDAQPAAIPVRQGVLVTVPSPARFALHKLVVSQRRVAAFAAKARKDVMQAQAMIDALLQDRPGDLVLAWEAALAMPPKFAAQLQAGMQLLEPETRSELARMK